MLSALSRRGLLPEWVWRRFSVEWRFEVGLPGGSTFLYEGIAGDNVAGPLFWRGLESYEPETICVFWELAKNAQIVLDVGAYTGLFTLLACAANPESSAIAFEPVPQIFARLKANILLNNLEARCEIHNKAASNVTGTAEFRVPSTKLPTSSSLSPTGFRGYRGTLIEVPVATVDAVIPEGTRVDLIKLDVEGFEDKALEGMHRVLSASMPSLIVECLPDGPYQAVETLLGDLGYRFYCLRPEGPVAVDRIVPDVGGVYRNFLFTVRDLY